MSSSEEARLIERLVDSHRHGVHDVDANAYAGLDRAGAYRIQAGVAAALGQRVGMLKTAIQADGVGVAAPIYAGGVGNAPAFRLPRINVVGVEVEVGVVLKTDLPGAATEAELRAAIDHYFLGVEICGTRYIDRKAGTPATGLADNMSSLGYAIGPPRADDSIAGLTIHIAFNGEEIYAAPAKHGFGTVLASVIAYSAHQQPGLPLRAGMIITTGSMCGLVPTDGPGHVTATLGDESLEFDIA